jgi:CxxH/CxxC protein (TIGR04129 family)
MDERFCCTDHMDIALDDFVDCFQKAPEMEELTTQTVDCHFCSQPAQYHLYHQPEEE